MWSHSPDTWLYWPIHITHVYYTNIPHPYHTYTPTFTYCSLLHTLTANCIHSQTQTLPCFPPTHTHILHTTWSQTQCTFWLINLISTYSQGEAVAWFSPWNALLATCCLTWPLLMAGIRPDLRKSVSRVHTLKLCVQDVFCTLNTISVVICRSGDMRAGERQRPGLQPWDTWYLDWELIQTCVN